MQLYTPEQDLETAAAIWGEPQRNPAIDSAYAEYEQAAKLALTLTGAAARKADAHVDALHEHYMRLRDAN